MAISHETTKNLEEMRKFALSTFKNASQNAETTDEFNQNAETSLALQAAAAYATCTMALKDRPAIK